MSIVESFKESFDFEGKKLRVYGNVDEPWFFGRDVSLILGYKEPKCSLRQHVDEEDRMDLRNIIDKWGVIHTPLKTFNKKELAAIYINELGLYSLILRSKLEGAKYFFLSKLI